MIVKTKEVIARVELAKNMASNYTGLCGLWRKLKNKRLYNQCFEEIEETLSLAWEWYTHAGKDKQLIDAANFLWRIVYLKAW